MTWRTPSSLKWLIVKRSRISGALLSLDAEKERLLACLATVERQADALRIKLAAVDQTFSLHEIQVEPEEIRPVQPQRRQRLMPPGQLGRAILGELRNAGGWLTSTEILQRISDRINPVELDYYEIRKCVRRRLGSLSRQGVLERQISLSERGRHDGAGLTRFRIANLQPAQMKSTSHPPKEIAEVQLTLPMSTLPVAGPPLRDRGGHQSYQE